MTAEPGEYVQQEGCAPLLPPTVLNPLLAGLSGPVLPVRALDEALLSARVTGSYLDRYVDLFRPENAHPARCVTYRHAVYLKVVSVLFPRSHGDRDPPARDERRAVSLAGGQVRVCRWSPGAQRQRRVGGHQRSSDVTSGPLGTSQRSAG